jgi:hypothetical protein
MFGMCSVTPSWGRADALLVLGAGLRRERVAGQILGERGGDGNGHCGHLAASGKGLLRLRTAAFRARRPRASDPSLELAHENRGGESEARTLLGCTRADQPVAAAPGRARARAPLHRL